MKQYLGAKLVQAEPANKGDDPGYFIQYPDGYTSWSPKAVFEEAYREVGGLTYGLAQEALLKGIPVYREGWPKGKHLVFRNQEYKLPAIEEVHGNGTAYMWLAPQIDLLATDWKLMQ